ncbi:MAG: hypothetical protein U5L06_06995 [Rhodovibrio sp.]|nr:hypothetical protein [Rhodovibrio sp.]
MSGFTFTVANLVDGGDEVAVVDGTDIALTNGANGTTAGNGLTYSVSVAGGTATVTISGGTLSTADAQTVINGLAYRNDSDDPTTGSTRDFTLTEIVDDGGTANGGADTGTPAGGTSNVTVQAVNDAPTLLVSAANPTFTEGGAAANPFSSTSIGHHRPGQSVAGFALAVANLADGGDEVAVVDGTDIALTNGANGATAGNGLTYSVVASGTATVAISGGTLVRSRRST